jgi:hypothetical protein
MPLKWVWFGLGLGLAWYLVPGIWSAMSRPQQVCVEYTTTNFGPQPQTIQQ